MELVLVHPDAPDYEVRVESSIQLAAYKSQGFVEKSELNTSAPTQPESNELEKLKAELAEAKADLEKEQTKSSELESQVAELKKELKTQKSRDTREANKTQKPDGKDKSDKSESENK